jgi:hypothetical protein
VVQRSLRPLDGRSTVPPPVGWKPGGDAIMVYLIRIADDDILKVGMSADPVARLRDLQVANYRQLWIAALIPGHIHVEKRIHEEFKEDRIQGEWFLGANRIIGTLFDINPKPGFLYDGEQPLLWPIGWDSRDREYIRRHFYKIDRRWSRI